MTATATEKATGSIPVVATVAIPTVDSAVTFTFAPERMIPSIISTDASVTDTTNARGRNSAAMVSLDTATSTFAFDERSADVFESISPAMEIAAVPTFTLKKFATSVRLPRRSTTLLVWSVAAVMVTPPAPAVTLEPFLTSTVALATKSNRLPESAPFPMLFSPPKSKSVSSSEALSVTDAASIFPSTVICSPSAVRLTVGIFMFPSTIVEPDTRRFVRRTVNLDQSQVALIGLPLPSFS